MQNSQRVITNTLFLYTYMIVNICVQLIAVRLVFNALGEVNYGIYNVIAGIVAMFGFMNGAMTVATQRYLSYEHGKKGNVAEIFYYSVILHLIIGTILVLCLEAGGTYYINHIMEVPEERTGAAMVLLHCITASTFVNIITVPYEANIIANEDMGAIAGINIIDALMKLCVAIFIGHTPYDKLICYGALTMTSLIITLCMKRLYCLSHYPESHVRWHNITDYRMMKNMASFAGWNFIGAGCSMARYHGTSTILNLFFGITINAAYGIAQQINGLICYLSVTITRAIRPQITKSAGAGDMGRLYRLSATASKLSSMMMCLLAVPLYVEMPFILELWLKSNISQECIMFCRLYIVVSCINQLTAGLQIAVESVGKIRWVQIILGSMHLLALPAGYIFFIHGFPPQAIMYCIIAEETLGIFVRTYLANRLTGIGISDTIIRNVIPCVTLGITTLLICSYVHTTIGNDWTRVICVSILSTAILCSVTYFVLLTQAERNAINGFISKTLRINRR